MVWFCGVFQYTYNPSFKLAKYDLGFKEWLVLFLKINRLARYGMPEVRGLP